MANVLKAIVFSMLLLAAWASQAGELVRLPTRPDVTLNFFWHETSGAKATVLIFPGGGGGFGRVENGMPTSGNFLVRTARLWTETEGFNYAVFGKPTDMADLDYPDRVSEKHLEDIRATIQWLKTKTTTPIYIVGTSRGTISSAFALINIKDSQIAGGVLTSSVTAYKKMGAVPTQDLSKITIPMLILHHQSDACEICRPCEVPAIIKMLNNAPIKKLMMVVGGSGASGNPCEGQHFHGFIGMETEVVRTIADWIHSPVN